MPVKVNLIKNRHTLSERDYQRERGYYKQSIIVAIGVVVVTMAVTIWQFILTRRLSAIESSIQNSTSQLQGLSEANAKQIYLKSRLKLITSFLDDRTVSRQAIQKVFSVDIPGVTISSANFESDSHLNIQATSISVQSFTTLVDYFSQESDFFLQVLSKGVSRTEDGKYQMDLVLTIPKS